MLEINGHAYRVPRRFEDLTKVQYVGLSRFVRAVEPRETVASHSAALLSLFRGKEKKRLQADLEALELDDIMNEGNRLFQTLRLMIGWAFSPVEVKVSEGVVPIIESFHYKGITYRLPQKNLNDTVVYEWQYIDTYLRIYSKTHSMEDLLELVATVCRPARPQSEIESPDFDGYYRERFNPETIEKRARHLAKVPTYVLHAVVDYCSRALQWLPMRYAPMFQASGSKGKNYGWEGTITDLAESGVFGTADQVRYTLIHPVCRRICQKKEQAKAAQKQLKTLRKT